MERNYNMNLFWIGAAFGTMFGISFWMRERLRQENECTDATNNAGTPGTTETPSGGGPTEQKSAGSGPSALTPPRYDKR